jgi:hypothetical protein
MPAAGAGTGPAWFGDNRPPSKSPRKANVFEGMMTHQGMQQQKELFPFFGADDLVPAAAFSYSLPGMPRFHFYHYNDQQEIVLTLAAEGGSLTTGQLYVQSASHGVTMFLKKAAAPEMENYQVSIITIRMKEFGPQNEAIIFRCGSCNEIVFRYDRDVHDGPLHKYYRELPSIRLYADAADAFNASDRTCPACGEQQAEFPHDITGWRRNAQYVTLANKARQQIADAAGDPARRASR